MTDTTNTSCSNCIPHGVLYCNCFDGSLSPKFDKEYNHTHLTMEDYEYSFRNPIICYIYSKPYIYSRGIIHSTTYMNNNYCEYNCQENNNKRKISSIQLSNKKTKITN